MRVRFRSTVAVVLAAAALTAYGPTSTASAELPAPGVAGEAGRLIRSDGFSVDLPVEMSIVAETVNGLTTWSEMHSVAVPAAMLGLDDELTPPNPADLLPVANDPAGRVTRNEPEDPDINDYDEIRWCESDGSNSVKSCLKMMYNSYSNGNKRFVQLAAYHHRWIRSDTSVAWSNAFSRAGVMGYSDTGSYHHDTVRKNYGTPVGQDAWFAHKPSWAGVYIDVNRTGGYQVANNEITLSRRSTTWTLVHSNVVLGTNPGTIG